MKNHILTFCAAWCSMAMLHAQVPNAGFESWSEYRSLNPALWTANGSIDQVQGRHGKALRMAHNAGDVPSFAALANLGAGGVFGYPLPGFAYTLVPDSIGVLFRANLAAGDTANLLVVFTNQGNPVSNQTVRIGGNTGGNWKYISMPLPGGGLAADSGIIIISSLALDAFAQGAGYLDVDSISFVKGAGMPMAPPPNGGFNDWDSLVLYQPDRYLSSDRLYGALRYVVQNVLRESKARSGASALRLQTGAANGLFGAETLGAYILSSLSLDVLEADPEKPSFPVQSRVSSFRGFYQLNTVGDTAQAEINMFYQGNLVGNGVWRGAENIAAWTEFSADINYDPLFSGTPDSATVSLSLLNPDGLSAKPGNWFLVDDLYLSNWATSNKHIAQQTAWKVYPNPAKGRIYLEHQEAAGGQLYFRILDMSGREIRNGSNLYTGTGAVAEVNVEGLPAGAYLLQCRMNETIYQQRILVQP
ncbi:MAG: Secretion system C-terminal sorting domain [Bacteroidota bacterium]|jgi:hypothetical protein